MGVECFLYTVSVQWAFMNRWKPEVKPGAWEESAPPAWLVASSAMNARDAAII